MSLGKKCKLMVNMQNNILTENGSRPLDHFLHTIYLLSNISLPLARTLFPSPTLPLFLSPHSPLSLYPSVFIPLSLFILFAIPTQTRALPSVVHLHATCSGKESYSGLCRAPLQLPPPTPHSYSPTPNPLCRPQRLPFPTCPPTPERPPTLALPKDNLHTHTHHRRGFTHVLLYILKQTFGSTVLAPIQGSLKVQCFTAASTMCLQFWVRAHRPGIIVLASGVFIHCSTDCIV